MAGQFIPDRIWPNEVKTYNRIFGELQDFFVQQRIPEKAVQRRYQGNSQ